ncbi:MAG TPA: DUF2127 domain-containing protein [Streptosporangiaceae bacterium]|jgi:uncharacterized membrane protein (DUF2068 family)
MDWSMLACGRSGHVTFAPEEPGLREQLHGQTAGGEAWRCLRCGTFVPGPPELSGPAAGAPQVRRGKEVRSALILRFFAVERFIRAVVFLALAYGLWRFKYARQSIDATFDRERPIVRELFRQLGYNINDSKLIGLIQHALTLSAASITLLAAGLAAYAAVEVIEGAGLWLGRRWGEYFAMVATSAGLPLEIYDLSRKVTVTTLIFFAINLALVLYLVLTKRLFGARGGKTAYEARLRSESIMEAAAEAAAAQAAGEEPAGDHDTAGRRPAAGELAVQKRAAPAAAAPAPAAPAPAAPGAAPPHTVTAPAEPGPSGAGASSGPAPASG